MAKKPTWPKHEMGKRCGYTLNEDGSIIPAPTYQNRFDALEREQAALDHVLKTVTSHCAAVGQNLVALRKQLWRDLYEDLGIDQDEFQLRYNSYTNKIEKVPIAKEPSPPSEE